MSTSLSRFFDYISGERRGVGAVLVRGGLAALSAPYWLGCAARRAAYNSGFFLCRELDAKVISIGNITTGGTGKTPLVIWVLRWLEQRGVPAAILSRGYGARPADGQGESDEMLLLRRHVPSVPHLVGKDRFATGRQAIGEHGAECLVLDDGFQHLALGRDLDIVLIDSLMPFGYGHVLPRGLLREPLTALRRADVVVLTRCDLCPRDRVRDIQRRIHDVAGLRPVVESAHRPTRFYAHATGESRPLGWIKGRRAFAFSALGNPTAFPRTLESLGAEVVHHELFRDHHWYDDAELAGIADAANEAGADLVVTTEKDAVKIRSLPHGAPPIYVLAVEFTMTHGGELLTGALEQIVGDQVV